MFLQERSLEDRIWFALGRDSVVGVASLRTGRSGDRITVGGEIFSTRPDPASCKIGPGFLSQGLALTTHSRLALRLKKE